MVQHPLQLYPVVSKKDSGIVQCTCSMFFVIPSITATASLDDNDVCCNLTLISTSGPSDINSRLTLGLFHPYSLTKVHELPLVPG